MTPPGVTRPALQARTISPMAHYDQNKKGGEQPGTRVASVGRYAASETPRTKTPDPVIGFVGMLIQGGQHGACRNRPRQR